MLDFETLWVKETELHDLREKGNRFEGEGWEQSVLFGQASEEVRCEEDEKTEVDREVDSKKK